MIHLYEQKKAKTVVKLVEENEKSLSQINKNLHGIVSGKYLDSYLLICETQKILYAGIGALEALNRIAVKEIFAKIIKEIKKYKISEFDIDLRLLLENNVEMLPDALEGLFLGLLDYKEQVAYQIGILGIPPKNWKETELLIEKNKVIVEGILFARNMVNKPGNQLRPMEFANQISKFLKDTTIEIEVIDYKELCKMNMNGLVEVGGSSEFLPCLYIMRYKGNPKVKDTMGLVGKGVTCDTGGYCLKPAKSMTGIKGDMAGGAAVVGAMYALAKNKIKNNIVAVIPICENRISKTSLLPGDVITSYSGKTIEVLNTDAEGRLILADAVSYIIEKEKVDRVLDVATLTGAVVNMLGFSVAGVLADNEQLWEEFQKASLQSGERYLRLPYYKEHERMIESSVADVKNMGEAYCGTITAGLFVRMFAEGKPWIHLDIAGTAWTDNPVFEFQNKGGTGAGVTSIYHFCALKK